MVKLGIALIVVAVVALPVAFLAAVFGFAGIASAASTVGGSPGRMTR